MRCRRALVRASASGPTSSGDRGVTRATVPVTYARAVRLLELVIYRFGACKSRVRLFTFALFIAIFSLDAFLSPPTTASVLYALPVFIAGLGLGGFQFMAAIAVAVSLGAADLAIAPQPFAVSPLILNYWIAGALVGLSAGAGWLVRQRLIATSGAAGGSAPRAEIQRFMDVTLDCVCIAGLDGLFRQVNNALTEFVNRPAEELLGTPFIDYIHEDDREVTRRSIARVASGSDVQSLRIRVRRADGVYRWFDWNCPAMGFGEDTFYAAGRDVTEREKSEGNTRLLAAIVESSEDGIVGISLDCEITSWNPAAERIYGFSAADAIGKSVDIIIPSDRRAQFGEIMERVRRNESVQRLESSGRRNDGQQIDVSLTVSLIRDCRGDVVGASVSVRDISDEKRYQRALVEMQARLERAVRGTYDGLWDWNVLSDHVWFAPRFRELLGYTDEDEFTERFSSVEQRLHPEDRVPTLAALRAHLDADRAFDVECRLRTKAGQWKWFRMRGASVRVRDNVPIRVSGSIQDISDIKQVTQSLVESEERIRLLLDRMGEGIYGIDAEGTCTFCNPACSRMLGYDHPDQLLHRPMYDLIRQPGSGDDAPRRAECGIYKALQTAEEFCSDSELFWRADGTRFPVEYRAFPITQDGEVTGAVVTFWDITQRLAAEQKLREQEERLRHIQRMEAVGQLAGGVAHEYNNLLQAITGFTRFAQQSVPAGSIAHQDLEQALLATERAATLTRQLLNFSRRDKIRPLRLTVAKLMSEFVTILRPCIPESVELQFDVRDEDALLYADPNLIQQVLMNLCVNARDAMDSVGTLSIRTQRVVLDDKHASPAENIKPGTYMRLSVTDTGIGIPPEFHERIFDPFFTTKEVGQGTGMGLATVFGAVQQHGGFVRLASEVGKGTTFHVHLPLHNPKMTDGDAPLPAAPADGKNELILVAEDDALVREVVVRILEDAGYRTLTAEDGEQAVDVFSAHADEVDLLLFDVVMPNMGGKAAATAIRLARPDIPVGFCTGYDSTAAAFQSSDFEPTFLVEKPFNRNILLQTVRTVLDERTVTPTFEGSRPLLQVEG